MKTQTLQQMQKGQKHVIKLIFIVLLINSCTAQEKKDDYYFLNKIIEFTKQPNDSVYLLTRRNETRGTLENYYKFRFNGRPFYTTMVYDSITDKVGYDTLQLQQNQVRWKAMYKVLDSAFTKEDLDRIIARKRDTTKWDSTNIGFNKRKLPLIKWTNSHYSKNFISKPYYNEKKTHAFIVSSHTIKRARTTRIYVFKKENEDWNILSEIYNVGW